MKGSVVIIISVKSILEKIGQVLFRSNKPFLGPEVWYII